MGKLPLKIIVPLTDWKNHYTGAIWMVKIEPDKNNKPTKRYDENCNEKDFSSYIPFFDIRNKFKVFIQRKDIGTQPLLGLEF